jgi:hypothetical protein
MVGVYVLQGIISLAVGVGILLGVGGVLVYEELSKNKRRQHLEQEVARRKREVAPWEIPNKWLECNDRERIVRRKASIRSISSAETDSIRSIDDDEYFDCSDEDIM